MASTQCFLCKIRHLVSRVSVGRYSDIKKSVFLSQSKDIFTNLALEDWLYKNFDFKNHHILILWQSDPCVVIGRHQNPWLEANLPELPHITKNGVKLARRNSGGGTVYHDHGNLNLTFFTTKERYSRKYNLEVIARALFRKYNATVEISPREDLMIRNYKISGSASRLGRPNAYHHCTLLVNSNKQDLSLALQKQNIEVNTKASRSVISKIMNLCEEVPDIDITSLIEAIGWEYLRTPALTITDGGMELANQQKGFQMTNPTESLFPGLDNIREDFMSWNWLYGRTPDFVVTKSFEVPTHLTNGKRQNMLVTMTVEKGNIAGVKLKLIPEEPCDKVKVATTLIGHRFSIQALSKLSDLLNLAENGRDRFVTECLEQVVSSF
ncbi:unnamed protein product [Acanthoscelides obtectus]|uniref:BPL/LPL catalytic domain-containing protein n=1 Tax=Acanthoscelides obtectus TaxID=200917 RepID=A0A9P0LT27_ACAOB|nr:unnamed protein product [Acanthoscelides obtectus]CAK1625961.1 Lipoyltransferase 1, mitochondrial [Acanthoscelides obtectus]